MICMGSACFMSRGRKSMLLIRTVESVIRVQIINWMSTVAGLKTKESLVGPEAAEIDRLAAI